MRENHRPLLHQELEENKENTCCCYLLIASNLCLFFSRRSFVSSRSVQSRQNRLCFPSMIFPAVTVNSELCRQQMTPTTLRSIRMSIPQSTVTSFERHTDRHTSDRSLYRPTKYDTIRDAILTCARKPTRVSLIYRTESTTKKCKTEKLSVPRKKKKGCSGEDLQKRKVLSLK